MERNSSRAITALLVAMVSIPFTTNVIVSGHGVGSLLGSTIETREEIHQYQSTERQLLRRAYSRAMEYYLDLIKKGHEDAKKPDINDPMSFRDFIDREEIAEVTKRQLRLTRPAHASAPDADTAGTDQLTARQRELLRNYTRAGSCPRSMERIVPGFYRLCLSIVGHEAADSIPTGIETDLKALRSAGGSGKPATLKLRLEMLKQARNNDPSNRRSDGTGPLRPESYLKSRE